MELNENQKQFVLSFFKNEEYAGWKNIANSLIDKGYAIVPGNDCIWKGGIGNFIHVLETPDEYIDCVKYIFDLKVFLSSEYFKDSLRTKIDSYYKEIKKLEILYTDLIGLK